MVTFRGSPALLPASQDWALDVSFSAGLLVRPGTAVFTRGEPAACGPTCETDPSVRDRGQHDGFAPKQAARFNRLDSGILRPDLDGVEDLMPAAETRWTFLTNHALVLLCVAADPGVRVRDLADQVGITERAAQRILSELVEAGYIDKQRIGRRNLYSVHPERPLRHPLQRQHTVGELLHMLQPLAVGD